MHEFKNKTVVITGAGSGMGRAYAEEFGKLGAKLALNDVDSIALNETLAKLKSLDISSVYSEVFDVAEYQSMTTFAANVKRLLGNAHIVINNAGIEGAGNPVFHLQPEDFRRIMNINFFGVVNGSMAFIPQLLENEDAALVNVSSIFGLIGVPGASDYCASKFAVKGFTESLMAEFHESHVSIHCVHPGGIATNIARKERSREFAAKYLTTDPRDIALHVIKCIRHKKPKIVYGRDSLKTWLGSIFLPQRLIKGLVWKEMKKTIDLSQYNFLRLRNLTSGKDK